MLLRKTVEVHKKGMRFMSELYNRIDTLCRNEGITITSMCKACGASRASLSDLKMGRKQSLSAETLSKIANHFKVTVDFLLTGENDYRVVGNDEENPWEVELLDAFDALSLGNQVEAVAQVQRIKDRENKKMPTQNGERDGSEIMFALSSGGEQEITDEMFDEVKKFAAYIAQREKDKK